MNDIVCSGCGYVWHSRYLLEVLHPDEVPEYLDHCGWKKDEEGYRCRKCAKEE